VQKARRRLRLPARRLIQLGAVAALLLVGFGFWALYGSNWFRIERVSADGARVLTDKQILHAAAVNEGEPLLSVDREAVEKRLLATLPRLAKADVVRAWPDGIGLHVTERRPELVLRKAGKYVEVDAEGVRFATSATRPRNAPLLVMRAQESETESHFGVKRLRKEAVRVASALPARVAAETRVVKVRSYDHISLELNDGRIVLWGSGDRGESKSASLLALMKAAKNAQYFDVSVPSAPAASGS
jgi:cell division protein FtsQ